MDSCEMSAQETRRAGVSQFGRKPTHDCAHGHPGRLMSGKCKEFSRRDSCARFDYSEQRKPWTFQIRPGLTQAVLRRPASTNPQDLRSSLPHHAHKCRGRHTQSLPEVGGGQYATIQFGNNVASHETIIHQYLRYFLLYYKLFSLKSKIINEMISEKIPATIDTYESNGPCGAEIEGGDHGTQSLEDMTGRPCRLNHLEKHCRRDAEAVNKLFHLLSVQLPLSLQNQGHNNLAAQVVRKVLLSESVGIH
jgi:hypothetical protein